MGSHEIEQLLHQYGLGMVFVAVGLQALGLPLPGTTVLIAAALYAGTAHGLPIVGVIAAGTLGALVGTGAGFALGRWTGDRLLLWVADRLRQSPERVQRIRAEFAGHGRTWLFVGRWVSGLRNVVGLLAGSSGMPVRRFVPAGTAAALVWASLNALGYYWFGHALAGADTWIHVLLICLGLAWILLSLGLLWRRTLRRLRAPASAGPPNP